MRHRAAILALALATALPAPSGASAQVSETAVKAAFIPKFARYVSWPASAAAAKGPRVICIIGEDPYGRAHDSPGRVMMNRSAGIFADDCKNL